MNEFEWVFLSMDVNWKLVSMDDPISVSCPTVCVGGFGFDSHNWEMFVCWAHLDISLYTLYFCIYYLCLFKISYLVDSHDTSFRLLWVQIAMCVIMIISWWQNDIRENSQKKTTVIYVPVMLSGVSKESKMNALTSIPVDFR